MKKPRKASERRLAEEQAKRVPLDSLQAAIQERDDAEARGEAMFEKLRPALTIAEAEIERLRSENATLKDTLGRSVALHAEFNAEIARLKAALREIRSLHITEYAQRHVTEIIDDALSGKGKT